MDEFMKILRWVSWNIFLCYLIYFGVIENVVWAQNIFKFVMWFQFLTTLIIVLSLILNKSMVLEARKKMKSQPIPKYVNLFIDVPLVLVLVGFGWFEYGTLLSILWFLSNMQHNIIFGEESIK